MLFFSHARKQKNISCSLAFIFKYWVGQRKSLVEAGKHIFFLSSSYESVRLPWDSQILHVSSLSTLHWFGALSWKKQSHTTYLLCTSQT